MTIPMVVLSSILLLATGVILLVATRLVRALRHTVELESRIARMQEGLNLLTDTAETGFRQVATEIERLSSMAGSPVVAAAQTAPAARPTAARLRAATRRGRSVKEIAADEHVSEGEVRLRLSLAEASASGRTRKTTESGRAALRA
jgi:Tfp pilus assembly protein PilX